MDALTGSNMTFHTLPITGQDNLGTIGAVNTVDPAQIQAIIKKAFSAPPPDKTSGSGKTASAKPKAPAKTAAPVPPASTVTVDVYNAGTTHGLAGLVSQALVAKGYQAGLVRSAGALQSQTTVAYGAGASANGAVIAKYFGVTATPSSAVTDGHVRVILGQTATSVPASLSGTGKPAGTASASATPAATPSPTSSVPTFTTQNGDSVTVKAQDKYGIPCVY
jgi:hypothetical protein